MTTILVVGDERRIIELAEMYLAKDGYQMLRAGDGEEALITIQQRRPDLVVSRWPARCEARPRTRFLSPRPRAGWSKWPMTLAPGCWCWVERA